MLLLVLIACTELTAQIVISGKVADSAGEAAVAASVILYKGKSALIQQLSLTDEGGNFKIRTEDSLRTEAWLVVRALGYRPDTTVLTPGRPFEGLRIELSNEGYQLDDIVVNESRNGIVVRGDSVYFRVDRFSSDSLESMESVLGNLPGMVEGDDGNYFYQGVPVSEILLDNDNFVSSQGRRLLEVLRSGDVLDVAVQPSSNWGNGRQTVDLNLITQEKRANTLFGDLAGQAGTGLRDRYGVHSDIGLVRTGKNKLFLSGQMQTIGNPRLTLYDYLAMTGGTGMGSNTQIPGVFSGRTPLLDVNLYLGGINASHRLGKSWRFEYSMLGFSNRHRQDQQRRQFSEGSLLLRTQASTLQRQRFLAGRVGLDYEPDEDVSFSSQLVLQGSGSGASRSSVTELVNTAAIELEDREAVDDAAVALSAGYRNGRTRLHHQLGLVATANRSAADRWAITSAEGGVPFTRLLSTGQGGFFREDDVSQEYTVDADYSALYQGSSTFRLGGQIGLDVHGVETQVEREGVATTLFPNRTQTLTAAAVVERDVRAARGKIRGTIGAARQVFSPPSGEDDPSWYPVGGVRLSLPVAKGGKLRLEAEHRREPYLLTTPPGFYNYASPAFAIRTLSAGNRLFRQTSGTATFSQVRSGTAYSFFLRGLAGAEVASIQDTDRGVVVNQEVIGSDYVTFALGGNVFIRRPWTRNTKVTFLTTRYGIRLPNHDGATVNWRHQASAQQKFGVADVPFTFSVAAETQFGTAAVRETKVLTSLQHSGTYERWTVAATVGTLLQRTLAKSYAKPVVDLEIARRYGPHWSVTGRFATYAYSLRDVPQTVFLRQEQAYVTRREFPPAVGFLGVNYRL